MTLVVLLVLPSPVQSSMPMVAIAALILVVSGLTVVARTRPSRPSAWARIRSIVLADVHDVLPSRRAWLGIALASALAVAGHAATFLLAASTAGSAAPPLHMLPIALLVMTAMVLPSVVAGGLAKVWRHGHSAPPA